MSSRSGEAVTIGEKARNRVVELVGRFGKYSKYHVVDVDKLVKIQLASIIATYSVSLNDTCLIRRKLHVPQTPSLIR